MATFNNSNPRLEWGELTTELLQKFEWESAQNGDRVLAEAFDRVPGITHTDAERTAARKFLMDSFAAAGMKGEPTRTSEHRPPVVLSDRDDEDADVFMYGAR
jgi:hypothetical protein